MTGYFIDMYENNKNNNGNENESENKNNNQTVNVKVDALKSVAVKASRIERMKKGFKTHRAAVNFDKGFCEVQVTFDVERMKDNE